MGNEQIITMVDFSRRYAAQYEDFTYPTVEGSFPGTLVVMHWATHAIIHSFWELDNGAKFDCPIFRDSDQWHDIQNFSIGDRATIVLKKTSSGKIYLRGLERKGKLL